MSFFTNNASDRCPGRINGNPANGLCEKVCVEAEKVFDACIRQTQEEGVTLTLSDFNPASPTYPLTFLSAKSVGTEGVLTNVTVDRLPDRERFGRVQATVTVPMEVVYTDAAGTQGTATAQASFDQDIIMYIPEPSIIPYRIKAIVSIVAPEGTYAAEGTFSVSCCVTIIMKVVMTAEILVPSYGYATIPPCQEYTQEVCSGFFDLPIYPKNE